MLVCTVVIVSPGLFVTGTPPKGLAMPRRRRSKPALGRRLFERSRTGFLTDDSRNSKIVIFGRTGTIYLGHGITQTLPRTSDRLGPHRQGDEHGNPIHQRPFLRTEHETHPLHR